MADKKKPQIKIERYRDNWFQIEGYGCIHKDHISMISGRKWGTDKGVDQYNIQIRGTEFRYESNKRFTAEQLTEEIVRIIDFLEEGEDLYEQEQKPVGCRHAHRQADFAHSTAGNTCRVSCKDCGVILDEYPVLHVPQ